MFHFTFPRLRKKGNHHFVIGMVALVLVLFTFLHATPLRIYAIAAERYIQREVGSLGWQPDARVFLFHVPFHRQEHALSCEVASLRSALLGVGIDVSESELFKRLPKDTTAKHWDVREGTIWGDPVKGYVGNVDGRMPGTGYGVFAPPVAYVANQFASSSIVDVSDSFAIDRALSHMHPVIAWTVLGKRPSVSTWKTSDGTVIRAPIYEHTVVIVGYRGSRDRIEGVYLIDPLTSLRYESWEEFQWRTSFFDHAGIEIAPALNG